MSLKRENNNKQIENIWNLKKKKSLCAPNNHQLPTQTWWVQLANWVFPLTLRILANCNGYTLKEIWYSCTRSFQQEYSFYSWQALTDTRKQVQFEKWGFRMQWAAYFSYYFLCIFSLLEKKKLEKPPWNWNSNELQMPSLQVFSSSHFLFLLWFKKQGAVGKFTLS